MVIRMKEHEDIHNIRIENEMDRFGVVINVMEHDVFVGKQSSSSIDQDQSGPLIKILFASYTYLKHLAKHFGMSLLLPPVSPRNSVPHAFRANQVRRVRVLSLSGPSHLRSDRILLNEFLNTCSLYRDA